ncbi:hypothetical protein [Streptosporangium saharense]|uniref:hypothetical protein n=1 Tax=Streptosporangium saharense TaxID=1706840 RepID=UPI003423CF0C
MKLSITGMPYRTDYRLELDGHNVAHGLRRAVLDLDPSRVPTLELEIRVHEIERLDAEEVQVLLPEATRDLLTRIGWTPPGGQVQPDPATGQVQPDLGPAAGA